MKPLFSIVIPCRNEMQDIAATLDVCLAMDYEPKEIIVVDDSTDKTPQIVASYADRGVRLIHRIKNPNGCCGARNLGMQEAIGEYIVLLNSDARLGHDFLDRIYSHYQGGADFVIVRSMLKNRETIWGHYIYSHEVMSSSKAKDILWSEGFSCRRSAARAVGYIPGDFPVPFCRDWMFGEALKKAGFKQLIDLTITVEHVWPDTLKTFFWNQVSRGMHSSPSVYYFQNVTVRFLLLRETLKAGRTLLKYLLIVPAFCQAIETSRYSPRGWKGLLSLLWVGLVNDVAIAYGNFIGWGRLMKTEGFR